MNVGRIEFGPNPPATLGGFSNAVRIAVLEDHVSKLMAVVKFLLESNTALLRAIEMTRTQKDSDDATKH